MQAIKESYLYHLYSLLRAFFARQWEQSRFVGWLTGQKPRAPGLMDQVTGGLRRGLSWLCGKLRLDRILQGSIFLHLLLCAGAAVLFRMPSCGTLEEMQADAACGVVTAFLLYKILQNPPGTSCGFFGKAL